MAEQLPAKRYATRLVLMVAWLALFDQFVPSILRRLEIRRYESAMPFRFANSDLFGLHPLVMYLRENPRGTRRRVVFLGNSMTFGYRLGTEETLPAQFERLRPDTRVFNAAINGQALGTNYLITKAIIDSVDHVYVQVVETGANPLLPTLLPVDAEDLRDFGLEPPDPVERRLRALLGRVWRLYDVNDRLQTALFGLSTRQYLYINKRQIALRLLRPGYKPPPAAEKVAPPGVFPTLRAPRAPGQPGPSEEAELCSGKWRLPCRFARLAAARGKRVTFLIYEYEDRYDDDQAARFNTAFAPVAEVMVIHVPLELTNDNRHLNEPGAVAVAKLLGAHERERERVPR